MSEKLFRKQSLDKVTSPEQLNDYVRVSNPGVWMILAAVIILLAGVCVWGVFGHMESKLATVGAARDGDVTCYVKEADIDRVKVGTPVQIEGGEYAADESQLHVPISWPKPWRIWRNLIVFLPI